MYIYNIRTTRTKKWHHDNVYMRAHFSHTLLRDFTFVGALAGLNMRCGLLFLGKVFNVTYRT